MLTKNKKNQQFKKLISRFAERYDLVEFGDIANDDEIYRYRGITFSEGSKDSNYSQGAINGYDISLFARATHLRAFSGPGTSSTFTILALHLKHSGFPHLVIDSRKHDNEFYKSMAIRFSKLRQANQVLNALNASAANTFNLYTSASDAMLAHNLLDDTMLQRLITDYANFDVEILNDKLFVISKGLAYSELQLSNMLSESLWLAETFELKNAYSNLATSK